MNENRTRQIRYANGIRGPGPGKRRLLLKSSIFLLLSAAISLYALGAEPPAATAPATLDETRLALSKWIETQQIITKERADWQQGKEILVSRVQLVQKEITDLEEQIRKSQAVVDEAHKKRDELQKDNDALKAIGTQLANSVTEMESDIRRLNKALPVPVQERVQQLYARIPQDATNTKVAVAERYQNVVGILNEVNKANGEINVILEVHDSAQVQAIYIGLGQAYYINEAKGSAGVSHPTPEGWQWESSKAISGDVLKSLEIIQGKQTAVFVPLPMKIQ